MAKNAPGCSCKLSTAWAFLLPSSTITRNLILRDAAIAISLIANNALIKIKIMIMSKSLIVAPNN